MVRGDVDIHMKARSLNGGVDGGGVLKTHLPLLAQ